MWECDGKTELFDSTDRRVHQKARKICSSCPVWESCLKDALRARNRHGLVQGTWGGVLFGSSGPRPRNEKVTLGPPRTRPRRSQKSQQVQQA